MSRSPDPTAKIALLRAAEEVFAEKGLAASKIEEITRRAGLSKGAFYLHFESKDEAFKHVLESFLARLGTLLAPSLGGAPLTAEEALSQTLEQDVQIFEFLWQSRAIVRILQGCQGNFVYLFQAFRDEVNVNSQRWVAELQRNRLFRSDLDPWLVSSLLCGAYHELSHRMLECAEKPPIEEWLRKAQSAFMSGLGTEALVRAVEARNEAPRGSARTNKVRKGRRVRSARQREVER